MNATIPATSESSTNTATAPVPTIEKLHRLDSRLVEVENLINPLLAERDSILSQRAAIARDAISQRISNLPEELGVGTPEEAVKLIAAQLGVEVPGATSPQETKAPVSTSEKRGKGSRLDRPTLRAMKTAILEQKRTAGKVDVPAIASRFRVSKQTVYSRMDAWKISCRKYRRRETAAV